MIVINKFFNNEEYTLVDVYDFYGSKLFHFTNENSDIFCNKTNNKYITINDSSIIDKLRTEYFLNPPEFYFESIVPPQLLRITGLKNIKKIPDSDRDSFIADQIKYLKDIVDESILIKRLKNVGIYTADWNYDKVFAGGIFHPVTNNIYLDKNDVNSKKISGIRQSLHETIHALSGAKSLLSKYLNKFGLIEGATENIVEKKLGEKRSSCYINSDKKDYTKFNFSQKSTYVENVCIIRQMEHILQKDADKSILLGNNSFFKEFSQKYGYDTFRIIRHRANRQLHPERLKDPSKYFQDTQNFILERVFDKEFSLINSIEDANNYIEKLKNFETTRGSIPGDETFKKYYEQKLLLIKEKLIEKGYEEKEISEFEIEHQYKQQEYYPVKTEEEKENIFSKSLINKYAFIPAFKEIINSNPERIKFFTAKINDEIQYYLISLDDKPLFLDRLYITSIDSINLFENREESSIELKRYNTKNQDTIINEDGIYKIIAEDGKEIPFENRGLPYNIPNFNNLIELGKQCILKEEEHKNMIEQQKNALRAIANTQKTSSLKKISRYIKELFSFKTKNTKNTNDINNKNDKGELDDRE